MSRVPSGVADANGQRLGLTVGSLVTLSLEPPLVAIVLLRQAAMHELLREAGRFAVSVHWRATGARSRLRAACQLVA